MPVAPTIISLKKDLREREIPALLSQLASALRGSETRLKLVGRGRYRKDETRHRRYEADGATARQVVKRHPPERGRDGRRGHSQSWELEVETPSGQVVLRCGNSGWNLDVSRIDAEVEGASPAQLERLKGALRDHERDEGGRKTPRGRRPSSRTVPARPPVSGATGRKKASRDEDRWRSPPVDAQTLEAIRAFVEEREGWSVKRRSCAECRQLPTKKRRSDGRWKTFNTTSHVFARHLAALLVARHPAHSKWDILINSRVPRLKSILRCPDCGALYLFWPDDEDTRRGSCTRVSAIDAMDAAARWPSQGRGERRWRVWHMPSREPITD